MGRETSFLIQKSNSKQVFFMEMRFLHESAQNPLFEKVWVTTQGFPRCLKFEKFRICECLPFSAICLTGWVFHKKWLPMLRSCFSAGSGIGEEKNIFVTTIPGKSHRG